ncbi:hypothetical protein EON62_01105, partial [archaeon]
MCAHLCDCRAFDVASNTLLRDWTNAPSTWNSYRINENRRRTRLEVRAVDPAGNRDRAFEMGRNVYEWTFIPPFPWLALILSIVAFILLVLLSLYLYYRYKRHQALLRYLERRKVRKLRHRVQGSLAEYDEKLLQQVNAAMKKDVVIAKEDKREKLESRFQFGNRPPASLLEAPRPAPPPDPNGLRLQFTGNAQGARIVSRNALSPTPSAPSASAINAARGAGGAGDAIVNRPAPPAPPAAATGTTQKSADTRASTPEHFFEEPKREVAVDDQGAQPPPLIPGSAVVVAPNTGKPLARDKASARIAAERRLLMPVSAAAEGLGTDAAHAAAKPVASAATSPPAAVSPASSVIREQNEAAGPMIATAARTRLNTGLNV